MSGQTLIKACQAFRAFGLILFTLAAYSLLGQFAYDWSNAALGLFW